MSQTMKEAVQWWETPIKRFLYNLVTIIGGGLVLIIRSEMLYKGFSNSMYPMNPYVTLLFLVFGANFFYCAGWVLEILLDHYFKIKCISSIIRWLLFLGGSVFSFIWMFLLMIEFFSL
jgi:hypothetical protein